MKNYIKVACIGFGMATLSSCMNTLNTEPTTIFDAETVWGSKATVEGFINAAYSSIINDGYSGSGTCVGWEARTPNGVRCSQVGEGIDGVATELGLDVGNDWGPNRFDILRRCNMIITNVEANGKLSDSEKKELSAHGYLMRGMVFFNQARLMGRFVPVTQVFDVQNPDACKIPLTKSVDESYQYVIADLEKAAANLPETNGHGLPTKWAADVLLSRAALQAYAYTKDQKYLDIVIKAAKDVIDNSGVSLTTSNGMFNETDLYNSEILWAYYREKQNTVVQSYDELMRTYPNISTDNVLSSLSPIPLKQANGQTFEGWAIYFPTQDLVDQFLVKDNKTGEALPWYETSQYKENVDILNPKTITEAGQIDKYQIKTGDWRRIPTPQDFKQVNNKHPMFSRYHQLKAQAKKDGKNISDLMYQNRDKRFYTAIVYDKCKWIGEDIELNLSGNLSKGVRDKEDGGWYNTTTGYYWRKSNIENPEPRAYFNCNVALHFNLCRLGEAYLNLAEAYLCKSMVSDAVKAFNKTRTVHGDLPESKATTAEQAWKDYIRERNCELTNEGGDLYFSYLRWGKYGGPANHGVKAGGIIKDLDRPVYQMQISRDRTKILVNQMTLLNSAQRAFSERRYLLPIHKGWLETRATYGINDGANNGQNEGW